MMLDVIPITPLKKEEENSRKGTKLKLSKLDKQIKNMLIKAKLKKITQENNKREGNLFLCSFYVHFMLDQLRLWVSLWLNQLNNLCTLALMVKRIFFYPRFLV